MTENTDWEYRAKVAESNVEELRELIEELRTQNTRKTITQYKGVVSAESVAKAKDPEFMISMQTYKQVRPLAKAAGKKLEEMIMADPDGLIRLTVQESFEKNQFEYTMQVMFNVDEAPNETGEIK